jgi:hypothetical protein
MRFQRFFLPEQMDALEALDSQEGVNVDRISYVPREPVGETAIVRYEFIEDLILRERDNLDYIKKIVDNVREDKVLPALKNKDQRELYFLERYGIESYTAGRVWEYMKMQEKRKEVQ